MAPQQPIVHNLPFGGGGLLNSTNSTCYMNVMIQALGRIDEFREGVQDIEEPENEQEKSLGHLLKEIFTQLSTSTEPVSCKDLGEYVLALSEGELDYRVQNDTHEFLKIVQQNIRNSMKPELVDNIFLGAKISSITCGQCGPESASLSLEDYMEIQLSVAKNASVEAAMAEYLQPEFVKYFCDIHGDQDFTRTYKFAYFPPALFLQLVRMDYLSGSSKKINKRFTFPEAMDLSSFMMSPEGPLIYNLTGVIVHEGPTLRSGHYTLFLNVAGGWWKFNDEEVTKCNSMKEVMEANFGGKGGGSAYMLLYSVNQEQTIEPEDPDTASDPGTTEHKPSSSLKPPPRKRKGKQKKGQDWVPNFRLMGQRFLEEAASNLSLPPHIIEASTQTYQATNTRPLEVEGGVALAVEVARNISLQLVTQFPSVTSDQFYTSLIAKLSELNLK